MTMRANPYDASHPSDSSNLSDGPTAAAGSGASDQPGGSTRDAIRTAPDAPLAPGDEAPAGTPGTGEGLCHDCGGSGRTDDGKPCPTCGGSGKVTVGIGGA